ncbi:MAG: HTTM domain-containing protein [Saprospiraceae bacterium]
MRVLKKIIQQFSTPVDGRVLGAFRLCFGVLMVLDVLAYYQLGFIDKGLLAPRLLFRYEGFEWLPLFPPAVLRILLALKLLAALAIAAGLRVRVSGMAFALIQMYFLLLEKAYFNNHIYLYALIAFLLSFTAADRFYSLRRVKDRNAWIPGWHIWHLRLLIVVAYFFTGIVKLKPDWLLRQEPIRSMCYNLPPSHPFRGLIDNEPAVMLLTYAGFMIDIFAPLWLLHKGFRSYMIWVFAAFHTTNSILFDDIGVFPFVMLATLLLFYDAQELRFFRKATDASPPPAPDPLPKRLIYLSAVWFGFHVLFPLRFLFLPNPVDYTTIGNRFAWRVKADNRILEEFSISVVDTRDQEYPVRVNTYINDMQVLHLYHDPRSLAAFARFMKKEVAGQPYNIPNARIRARIRFRYNGRPAQYFVDPGADLATAPFSSFRRLSWVNYE